MDDATASNLHEQLNELQKLLTQLHIVMPYLIPYLLSRRDNFVTRLVEKNDDVIRGRIQELQNFLDLPRVLASQIEYRTQEINRSEYDTTQPTGLDAINGSFLQ